MRGWLAGTFVALTIAAIAWPSAAAASDEATEVLTVHSYLRLAIVHNEYRVLAADVVGVLSNSDAGGGFSYRLDASADVSSIDTLDDEIIPFTSEIVGDDLVLNVTPPLNGGFREYVIHYRQPAVVTESSGEKLWRVPLGERWPVKVAQLTITFSTWDEVAFDGEPRCTSNVALCTFAHQADDVLLQTGDRPTGETTIDVELPFTAPNPAQAAPQCPRMPPAGFDEGFDFSSTDACDALRAQHRWPAIPGLIVTVLSTLIIVTVIALRRRDRRGPRGRDVIIAEYAPPDDLNVMVAAHLLGRSRTAVPAQLLALALSKNIRLVERSMRRGRAGYAVQFVTFDGADDIGVGMMRALFGDHPSPGAVRELRASDRDLSGRVTAVSAGAMRLALARGWRSASGATQWLLLILALVCTLATGVLWLVVSATDSFSPWYLIAFFAAPIAFVVCVTNLRLVGRLTEQGALVRDHLIGIRDYLRLAEADRLRVLQGAATAERADAAGVRMIELYERLLPYAVIWGVDESWIRELVGDAVDLDAPPEWLSNPNALSFVGGLISLRGQWRFYLPGWGSKIN
jgi:hypothetical protein